jgi:hypothetical protein
MFVYVFEHVEYVHDVDRRWTTQKSNELDSTSIAVSMIDRRWLEDNDEHAFETISSIDNRAQ